MIKRITLVLVDSVAEDLPSFKWVEVPLVPTMELDTPQV